MVANYMDALLDPAKRVTRKAMDKLSLKHELASFSRCLTETSVLDGHAIHRVVKAGAKQCKIIACLKEEIFVPNVCFQKRVLEADMDMVTMENQTLENKNAELLAALEKEREEKKMADEMAMTLNSRLDKFKEVKLRLDSELTKSMKKNEKFVV
ncbi:hypothetical protein Dimus_026980 [Dionaea muscipula]